MLNDCFPANANPGQSNNQNSPFVFTNFGLNDGEDLLSLAINGIDDTISTCPSTPRSPLTAQELGEIEEAAEQVEDILKNGKLIIASYLPLQIEMTLTTII